MPNPRTLGTGGRFTPKSIKGLSLWLDASDPAGTYTSTIGPVDSSGIDPPTFLPQGIVAWYSADNPDNVVVDGKVAVLRDMTGLCPLAQNTASARPFLVQNVLNGKPVLRFDGEDFLTGILNGFTNFSHVFAVFRGNSAMSGQRRLVSVTLSSGQERAIAFAANSRSSVGVLFGNPPTTLSGSISGFDAFSVLSHRDYEDPGAFLRRNYDAASSAPAWSDPGGDGDIVVSVGAVSNGSSGFVGDLAELILVVDVLDDSTVYRLERYLAVKWGIAGVHSPTNELLGAVKSPMDISGCVAWWDASDPSVLRQNSNGADEAEAANDPVGYWADKSGAGNNCTQATANSRPTISPATLNGKKVIRLDGDNDFLTFPTTPIQSVFAVVYVNTAAGKVLGSLIGSSTSLPDLRRDANVSPSTRWRGTSTDGSGSDVNDFANSGSSLFRVNGISTPNAAEQVWHIVTAVRGTGPANLDRIGRAVASREFGGDIAEVICYSSAVSATDCARIEKYLAAKWATTAVPDPAVPATLWRDRSASGRNATQASTTNKPLAINAAQNGRTAVRFDGLDDFLTFANSSHQSIFMVLKVQSQAGRTLNSVIGQRNPNVPQDNAAVGIRRDIDGNGSATTKYRGITGANSGDFTNPAGSTFRINSSATDLVNDGVWHVLTAIRAGSPLANINCLARHFQAREFGGDMGEIICYDNAISSGARNKVERFLARKWGIQLPPTVSNADAQDWITRVYASGATVSADTAIAVNTFCNAIDAASLRDRFYRLNLFAGTGLNACLVPLYRGPSLGGTQYGGTTDTSNFFASGDYVETGSTGGLTSGTANTSKFLNTGLNASVAFASGNGHMSCYYRTINAPTGSQTWRVMGLLQDSPAQYYYIDVTATGGVGVSRSAFGGSSSTFGYPKTYSGSTFILTTRRSATDFADYYGATEFPQTVNTTSTPPSSSIYVFAENRNGTGALTHASGRIGMYSIGASMTTAQISTYRSIVDTFQATLSRNT